jgi:hypothetical protein
VNTATKPLQYAAGAHVDDNFALVVDQSFTGLQIQKLGGRMHRDSPLLMGSL